jgi:GNAT superfamily N-acetyltransferase
MGNIVFRMMEEGDSGEIVALMSGAFFHSALYTWTAPDEGERRRILNTMFHYRIRSWMEGAFQTELALEGSVLVGSATWIPPKCGEKPGKDQAVPPEEVLKGFSPGVAERWRQFQAVIVAQERAFPQPCWAVAPIAVSPEAQGKGIGSQLLRRKLAEIDRAGLPCFLATQDRHNLGIYGRFGFRTIDAIPIAPGGPVSYRMIRGNLSTPRY